MTAVVSRAQNRYCCQGSSSQRVRCRPCTMIPAQAQVEAPYHAQPLPQAAAAEDRPGCDAVAQLQSQIDSLQAHLFTHAVASQMTLSSAEHYVGAPTLADVNTFRNKQGKRFKGLQNDTR